MDELPEYCDFDSGWLWVTEWIESAICDDALARLIGEVLVEYIGKKIKMVEKEEVVTIRGFEPRAITVQTQLMYTSTMSHPLLQTIHAHTPSALVLNICGFSPTSSAALSYHCCFRFLSTITISVMLLIIAIRNVADVAQSPIARRSLHTHT